MYIDHWLHDPWPMIMHNGCPPLSTASVHGLAHNLQGHLSSIPAVPPIQGPASQLCDMGFALGSPPEWPTGCLSAFLTLWWDWWERCQAFEGRGRRLVCRVHSFYGGAIWKKKEKKTYLFWSGIKRDAQFVPESEFIAIVSKVHNSV